MKKRNKKVLTYSIIILLFLGVIGLFYFTTKQSFVDFGIGKVDIPSSVNSGESFSFSINPSNINSIITDYVLSVNSDVATITPSSVSLSLSSGSPPKTINFNAIAKNVDMETSGTINYTLCNIAQSSADFVCKSGKTKITIKPISQTSDTTTGTISVDNSTGDADSQIQGLIDNPDVETVTSTTLTNGTVIITYTKKVSVEKPNYTPFYVLVGVILLIILLIFIKKKKRHPRK